jgi:hypothetical protein
MDILLKWLSKVRDYIHGFLEIASIETPRYSFIIEKFDITYHNTSMKTKINYTPVGCYRLFKNFAFELNDEVVCRKFKPDHARMIIGIDTLEKTLDFNSNEQTQKYIEYVGFCIARLRSKSD